MRILLLGVFPEIGIQARCKFLEAGLADLVLELQLFSSSFVVAFLLPLLSLLPPLRTICFFGLEQLHRRVGQLRRPHMLTADDFRPRAKRLIPSPQDLIDELAGELRNATATSEANVRKKEKQYNV